MPMWSACSISGPTLVCRPLGTQPRTRSRDRFVKTIKCEEVYVHQYHTFEEAQACLQSFLEDVYTTKRLHLSLVYVPPDEFELQDAMC